MRFLIAMLCLLMVLAQDAGAAKRRKADFAPRTIAVRDYTSATWDGLVEPLVQDLNALAIDDAPTFLYQPMSESRCRRIARDTRGLAVCSLVKHPGWGAGESSRGGLVRLNERYPAYTPDHRLNTVCHELMHSLTDIPHRFGDGLTGTSCVWDNQLTTFGPVDRLYLQRAFRREHR